MIDLTTPRSLRSPFLRTHALARTLVAAACAIVLAACGGGGGSGGSNATGASSGGGSSPGGPGATIAAAKPATDQQAARFLQQATFGFNASDVAHLKDIGYAAWIDEQMAMPVAYSHANEVRKAAASVTGNWANRPGIWDVNDSMWIGLVDSPDQLRQRTMFALSQIFVVSLRDGSTYYLGNGLAAYPDMLYAKGFGNFRDLLESVTTSTAMGSYLSSVYNSKEDPATGQMPDQNYAREVMQLFTIGLWQLNADGSRKLDANGAPIPTYSTADVVGASKVLTGWAFDGATDQQWSNYYGFWAYPDNAAQERPMVANPAYHSTSEKRFLGKVIPASSTSDPVGDLKIFLDTLFNHPNVGPFIGRQLIQRFVTSNPSPAYVQRVAAVFANNGQGVRGDMKAVIKAVLLDAEARDDAMIVNPTFGKLREPVLRMAQLMRVFNATRVNDPYSYRISLWTYDRSKGLWQTPLGSNSVFNFYFPDYKPGGSDLAKQGLVAPEMQITTQSSVADQSHFFLDLLQNAGLTDCCSDTLRNTYYLKLDYSAWLPLVDQPPVLVEALNQRFMAGQMPQTLKDDIVSAMAQRWQASSETSGMVRGVAQIKLAEAIYTMLLSPEYVVQK